MSGIVMIFPILLLFLLIWWIMRSKNRMKFQLNKKITYTLVATYVVILLIATITVEIYEKKFAAEMPDIVDDAPQSIGGSYNAQGFEPSDSTSILDKREHIAGDRLELKIHTSSTFDYESTVDILIKRKSDNDGVIEETIYSPILFNDGFDFSDRFQYTLPEWDEDTVFFFKQPETIINYSTYRDAFLLSQFTKKPMDDTYFRSYGGMSRQIIIHLLVPKDLEIDAPEDLYINYLDE